jgi:hypothetical protein
MNQLDPSGALRTFNLMIQDDRYAVPTVAFVLAVDETEAREQGARRLAESPHHLAVEIFEHDRLIFRITRDKPFVKAAQQR